MEYRFSEKNTDFKLRKTWILMLALLPSTYVVWFSYLIFLNLHFHICKMGFMIFMLVVLMMT